MFLLVPAHPGFPGQIPQSRKTVVFVVCCLMEKVAYRELCRILVIVIWDYAFLVYKSTVVLPRPKVTAEH